MIKLNQRQPDPGQPDGFTPDEQAEAKRFFEDLAKANPEGKVLVLPRDVELKVLGG